MTQRKPGDYVINAELTDEQRERFVADCVAAGAYNEYDLYDYPLTRLSDVFTVGGQLNHWTEVGQRYKNNVTHEYKEATMTAQSELMHAIGNAMERNPEGWPQEFQRHIKNDHWITCDTEQGALIAFSNRELRRKPRTYTLRIEEMPEPLRENPKIGEPVYVLELWSGDVAKLSWDGSCRMGTWLDCGLCYTDESTAREALEKLTKAMGGGE